MDADQLKGLTPRERQVLELLARGLRNEDIARVLKIAASTVKNHVAAILQKTSSANRTEAVGLLVRDPASPLSNEAVVDAGQPAIAVLQLNCADGDVLTRQLADGIVDDLITRLSRRWYPVIARCSTFSVVACEGVDARAIGVQLGARYLVEGSLSRRGSRLRLNVSLVDAGRGYIIWSEQFDQAALEVFEMLDALSYAVMERVYIAAVEHTAGPLADVPYPRLQPWQVAVCGMWHFWRGTAQHNLQARALFAEALKAEPDQRISLYGTALTYQREISEQWAQEPRATVDALEQASARFLRRWPEDSWALLMTSYTEIYRGHRSGAIHSVQRAIECEPSLLGGRSLHGQLLAMDGQSELAVDELKKALLLSPCTPDRWVQECALGLACFAGEQYEEAVSWGEKAARSSRAGAMAHGVLASSHYFLGNRDKAKSHAAKLLELAPTFSSDRFGVMLASTRQDIAARYLEGLGGAAAC